MEETGAGALLPAGNLVAVSGGPLASQSFNQRRKKKRKRDDSILNQFHHARSVLGLFFLISQYMGKKSERHSDPWQVINPNNALLVMFVAITNCRLKGYDCITFGLVHPQCAASLRGT